MQARAVSCQQSVLAVRTTHNPECGSVHFEIVPGLSLGCNECGWTGLFCVTWREYCRDNRYARERREEEVEVTAVSVMSKRLT